MLNKVIALLYLYCLISISSFANSFIPVISKIVPDIKNIGLQNWSITQNNSGEIFIGNNLGILSYDGYYWDKITLEDNEVARAILAVDNRLYVGSCNSFGYFQRDDFGKWEYTSLSSRLPKERHFNDYDIWGIYRVNGKIYFQSFNAFFIYDGKDNVTPFILKNKLPLYCSQIGEKLYVQLVNSDLCELKDNKYQTIISGSYASLGNVVSVIPYKDNELLLCTEWKGLFIYDGRSVKPFKTSIDNAICREQINRAVYIPQKETIILGTIMNGIYCIKTNGEVLYNYNMNHGMTSNSVLSLFCDNGNNVWAGLDVGMALIHTGAPYSILSPSGKYNSIGMTFDVIKKNNNLFIATNQRVWNYNYTAKEFNPIIGTEGQNWYVADFDGMLMAGNNKGLKYINDHSSSQPTIESGSTSIKECKIHNQNILLESSYTKLHIYKKISNLWKISNTVEGLEAPIRNFEVDNSGIIWASHMNKGLYRIELTNDLKKISSVKFYPSLMNTDAGEVIRVMKIRGRIVFSNRNHIYTYDDINRNIVPFEQLDKLMNKGIISATMVDDNKFWLSDVEGYTLVEYTNGNYRQVTYIASSLFGSVCNENSNRAIVDGDYTYFCMNNCIGQYNISRTNAVQSSPKAKMELRMAYSETVDKKRKALNINSANDNEITDNNIFLRFTFPNLNHENVRFEFCLKGELSHTVISDKPQISFSNLKYGNYTLSASAIDINGKTLASSSFCFINPKPIYLSYFAIVLYIILLIIVIMLISRYNTNRMVKKKNKEFEEEKLKQELKMLEQEKIIARQQQQLLEAELSNKSQKLATMALDAAALSSNIANLKEALTAQLRKSDSSKSNVQSVMRLINSEISDEDFWKIYHQNFDLIHKNFFRNLRSRYPSLTSVDLKFCALLRLNLSTKDIANFTSLTVRGVETARYRIRKKLNVPEGQNIIDFLIDLEDDKKDNEIE